MAKRQKKEASKEEDRIKPKKEWYVLLGKLIRRGDKSVKDSKRNKSKRTRLSFSSSLS